VVVVVIVELIRILKEIWTQAIGKRWLLAGNVPVHRHQIMEPRLAARHFVQTIARTEASVANVKV
jgi:hypothetical protein